MSLGSRSRGILRGRLYVDDARNHVDPARMRQRTQIDNIQLFNYSRVVARRYGVVDSIDELTVVEHACWGYRTPAERGKTVSSFLLGGIANGYRVGYAAHTSSAEMEMDLAVIGNVEELVERGTMLLLPGRDTNVDPVIDLVVREEWYATVTRAALDDGYRGFRVAADITAVVAEPDRFNTFIRHECQRDRFIAAGNPLVALCVHDRRAVDTLTAAQLAALHPHSNHDEITFRLTASDSDADLCLVGEVDAFGAALFERCLIDLPPPTPRVRWRIDATASTFIDHRALMLIDQHARAHRAMAVVDAGTVHPRLLAGLFDFQHLEILGEF